ncbi:MAG TPA: sigma-54 dependent transcriptional regulator [Pyrinomonadaceae bacterium]|jgi:DNA-binding NtrC family response regulator
MEKLIRHLRDMRTCEKLIGTSPAFLKSTEHLHATAASDSPVLISGETGTGKELVAHAIHYLSERAPYPFVPVNCGALPDTLLETELFGHERGAFTDAHAKREGLIAQAGTGTLFLDEVDALSPKAQVTLLRVLQDKRYRPVGGGRERGVSLRILAATNADLEKLVQAGQFRNDLYYRLCVFFVHLPPLRERRDDIALLASWFLKKHARASAPEPRLMPAALAELEAYDWPGNIRELENAIIRGIHLTRTEDIEAAHLGLSRHAGPPPPASRAANNSLRPFKLIKQQVIEAFERDYLIRLLRAHHGNVSHAARTAEKERRDLGKLLKKYQLDPRLFNSPESI